MNLTGIDLNLLRIFDAMMRERSATRVTEEVGLSQPAVSAALARLRHITKDELFIRQGGIMVPTSKAEAMHQPVRAAMERVEEAFGMAVPFDPLTSNRRFRLLGSDYFSTILMPPLAESVRKVAPGVVLQMLDMPSSEVVAALADDRVELALSPSTIRQVATLACRTLFASYVVTVGSKPVAKQLAEAGAEPGQRIPADVFCSFPHVVMSMDGSMRGTIDKPLEERGLRRHVSLTLPHFHAVALAAATGDMLGSLPVTYAAHIAPVLGLEIYLPPYDPQILDVNLYWHRRHDRDPGNVWLRERIIEVASRLASPIPPDEKLRAALEAHAARDLAAEA